VGLTVTLETERGDAIEQVGDPKNHLHVLLLHPDDRSFSCLRYIDLYGDTVFNQLQTRPFLQEWKRIHKRAKTDEERDLVDEIERLARACAAEPHRHLKFYGD